MSLSKNSKYDLKKKYMRILEVCMILSLAFLVLAFKYFPKIELDKIETDREPDIFIVDESFRTIQRPVVPPPPAPPVPVEAPDNSDLADIEFEETVLVPNDEPDYIPPPPKVTDEKDVELVPEFFPVAELMPTPIGGIEGIMKKIKYPDFAIRAGIEGKVHIYAYVDELGNVIKAEILKGIGGGCDEVALAAILKTKFNPGQQRGRNVKVRVAVPVDFRIE